MKCLFIFSLLIISVLTLTLNNATALQIAQHIDGFIAYEIRVDSATGIENRLTDNFKYRQCDGTFLNRTQMVEKLIETQWTGIPARWYIDQQKISKDVMYYIVDEYYPSGEVLSLNYHALHFRGAWRLNYGQVIKCC